MDLKLKGNSKYILDIVNLRTPMVCKSSYEKDDRLLKSIWKQATFTSDYFKVPKINSINDSVDKTSFEMHFIEGNSFVEFFSNAKKSDLDSLIDKIKGYFSERIKEQKTFPIKYFHEKLYSINKEGYDFILKGLDGIKMYVGECHGDMTFSNMIFSKDIYLIDFLDSYVESPTMDLIKLRQDTHLHYSLNMLKKSDVDKTKIKMCLNYIDDWLVSNYEIENYKSLQIINLLRIQPYAQNKKLSEWLENKIDELWTH